MMCDKAETLDLTANKLFPGSQLVPFLSGYI